MDILACRPALGWATLHNSTCNFTPHNSNCNCSSLDTRRGAVGCDAYNLVVTIPEEIKDMSSLEVDVSSLKAEVKSTKTKLALNLAWPEEINADIAKATFSKKKRTLTILAPVI